MTPNATAAKTTWEARHPGGHRASRAAASHDLPAKRTSERAGYPRRPATKGYADRWNAGRDAAARERTTWPAGLRSKEPAETEMWGTRAAIPAPGDSDRAVERGRQDRCQLLATAGDTLGLAEDDFAVRVEGPARRIDPASWRSWRSWSSQRYIDPGDVEELVTGTASYETATTNRNPY